MAHTSLPVEKPDSTGNIEAYNFSQTTAMNRKQPHREPDTEPDTGQSKSLLGNHSSIGNVILQTEMPEGG